MNENKIYLTAKELAGMLGVSESQAYKMIRKINLELEKKGFITMIGKRYAIEQKIIPYFGKRRLSDIKAVDIRKWQNELMKKDYARKCQFMQQIRIEMGKRHD